MKEGRAVCSMGRGEPRSRRWELLRRAITARPKGSPRASKYIYCSQ